MATVGAALLVAAATTLPQVIGSIFLAVADPSLFPANPFSSVAVDDDSSVGVGALVGLLATTAGTTLLQMVGLLLVTGMIAQVVMAACIGQTMNLAQAWAATLGTRWRMIGFALLSLVVWIVLWGGWIGAVIALALQDATVAAVLFALLGFPALVCLSVVFYIRLVYLTIPAICVERVGILTAISRSRHLTARAFWRTFGIALLTAIVVGVAGMILSVPLGFVAPLIGAGGGFSPTTLALLTVISSAVSGVLTTAITAPFTAAVSTLQYVDQRIRREGLDVELMAAANER